MKSITPRIKRKAIHLYVLTGRDKEKGNFDHYCCGGNRKGEYHPIDLVFGSETTEYHVCEQLSAILKTRNRRFLSEHLSTYSVSSNAKIKY